MERGKVDLRNCEQGDILIGACGAIMEYVSPTPHKHVNYLDHVVRYLHMPEIGVYDDNNLGSRTHDGYVFNNNRLPTDNDVVMVIKRDILKNILNK